VDTPKLLVLPGLVALEDLDLPLDQVDSGADSEVGSTVVVAEEDSEVVSRTDQAMEEVEEEVSDIKAEEALHHGEDSEVIEVVAAEIAVVMVGTRRQMLLLDLVVDDLAVSLQVGMVAVAMVVLAPRIVMDQHQLQHLHHLEVGMILDGLDMMTDLLADTVDLAAAAMETAMEAPVQAVVATWSR
jgi:hypothetical protein